MWCDGVPTGALLIHMAVIREMWKDAEPYTLGKQVARRIFDTPRAAWFNEATGQYNTTSRHVGSGLVYARDEGRLSAQSGLDGLRRRAS